MKKYLFLLILILILMFSVNCFATPWDVSTATYANKSVSVSAQDTYPYGMTFSSDGTKMYIAGTSTARLYQYTLSTAWDVSTASYANKFISVSSQDTYPYGMTFNSDGTKMYMVGNSNDRAYQYNLSTAWDVSTASYANKFISVSSQDTSPHSIAFNSDGTKMYMVGNSNDRVYQYNLSTAWDVSTASYANKFISVSSQDTYPHSIAFNSDGTKMYMVGAGNDRVYQYTLSTAWDVSTATYANKYVSVSAQDGAPYGIVFNSDGTKMYIVGDSNDRVYQYTLPAPPPSTVNAIFYGTNF